MKVVNRTVQILTISFLLVFYAANSIYAQTYQLRHLADSMAARYLASKENAGLSLAVLNEDSAWYFNYGEAVKGTNARPSEHSVYNLGGLSPIFTSYLLTRVMAEGKIKPDQSLAGFTPNKCPSASEVKVKHLASHTSGLPNLPPDLALQTRADSLDPYLNYSAKQALSAFCRTEVPEEPGRVYNYSSFGIGLLGIVLAKACAISFDSLLLTRACKPLNLKETGLSSPAVNAGNFTQNYDAEGNPCQAWHFPGLPGAGGVYSSCADIVRLMQEILNKKDLRQQVFTPLVAGRTSASYCWLLRKRKNAQTICWQAGAGNGTRSFAAFIPEKNLGVVILSNSSQDVEFVGLSILNFYSK